MGLRADLDKTKNINQPKATVQNTPKKGNNRKCPALPFREETPNKPKITHCLHAEKHLRRSGKNRNQLHRKTPSDLLKFLQQPKQGTTRKS
jgi:hypothetical protein